VPREISQEDYDELTRKPKVVPLIPEQPEMKHMKRPIRYDVIYNKNDRIQSVIPIYGDD
jgi:hypothetical protein